MGNACSTDNNICVNPKSGKQKAEIDGNMMRYKKFNNPNESNVEFMEISKVDPTKFATNEYLIDQDFFGLSQVIRELISRFGLYTWDKQSFELSSRSQLPVFRMKQSSGMIYEGHVELNKKNGIGYYYSGGDLWACSFQDDLAQGEGAIYFETGDYFVGKLNRGVTSEGTMHYVDGTIYEGHFMAGGYRHGYGMLTEINKTRYEGTWNNNQKDGPGITVSPQMWRNGVKVEIQPINSKPQQR